ncbi:hypothetical protein A2U01_0106303, partial [Trifolium medium]|nr:hypothetical protein [Trifolium medium]
PSSATPRRIFSSKGGRNDDGDAEDFSSSCFDCEEVVEAVSPLPDSWEVTGDVSDTAL